MFLKNRARFLQLFLILTINSYALISKCHLTPPVEFPKNESTLFPLIHNNVTILKVLLNSSEASEVEDLRKTSGEQYVKLINVTHKISEKPENVDKKWQTELIEDGSNTEDRRHRKSNNTNSFASSVGELSSKPSSIQGQIAVIIAGVIIIIGIIVYAGILSWRRFVYKRWGARQMLVNEEDFFEPNDMRDFTFQSWSKSNG